MPAAPSVTVSPRGSPSGRAGRSRYSRAPCAGTPGECRDPARGRSVSGQSPVTKGLRGQNVTGASLPIPARASG